MFFQDPNNFQERGSDSIREIFGIPARLSRTDDSERDESVGGNGTCEHTKCSQESCALGKIRENFGKIVENTRLGLGGFCLAQDDMFRQILGDHVAKCVSVSKFKGFAGSERTEGNA